MPSPEEDGLLGPVDCDRCSTHTANFYLIEYYILPHKLIKKRHKDKGRMRNYCQAHYEDVPELTIAVGGRHCRLPKTPKRAVPETCCVCGAPFPSTSTIHGLVTSTLVMSGSLIEHCCLGVLCATCAENHQVEFVS